MYNNWAVRQLQSCLLYRCFYAGERSRPLSNNADPTRLLGQLATTFASISFSLFFLSFCWAVGACLLDDHLYCRRIHPFHVLAVQRLAANLLPRQLFLRLSTFLQAGCLMPSASASNLFEPSLESPAVLIAPQNRRLLASLPSYWFLGFSGSSTDRPIPHSFPLGRRAVIGLVFSVLGAAAALLPSYFRRLPKIVEQPEILLAARTATWSPLRQFTQERHHLI